MDSVSLMYSLVFGTLGFGFLLYGKNAARLIPLGAGLGLMVFPCFITSVPIMLAVCIPLAAAPFVIRGS